MRLVTWVIGFIQILFFIWIRHPKAHLFIVSNPPIAPLLPLLCSNPFTLLIFDVYIERPQDYALLGKSSPWVMLWKKAYISVLKKARQVFTITDGMKESLEKYSKGSLVEVVPIWTDNDFLKPIDRSENPFIKKYGLENKFVVLYSGNIGASSGVESLVEAANFIKNEHIQFLIIGDGIKRKQIQKKIRDLNLTNCRILPRQEIDILPYSLASANLAVVSLANKSSKNSIPSKLFNYLSVGASILCIANKDSDLARFVCKENIGICLDHSDKQEIAYQIEALSNNKAKILIYETNSLKASKNYVRDNAKKFLIGI